MVEEDADGRFAGFGNSLTQKGCTNKVNTDLGNQS